MRIERSSLWPMTFAGVPRHPARTEPWGQTVARLQSPEGAIVGISYIPMFHDEN
jgi:hypothetical protein